MTSAGTTTRRYPRYKIDIRVRLIPPGSTKSIYGRGSEMGQGGMAIFAELELALGDRVEVEVPILSSSQPLRVAAIVRNRIGFRYGVEFVDLAPEHRTELMRLCEFMGPKPTPSEDAPSPPPQAEAALIAERIRNVVLALAWLNDAGRLRYVEETLRRELQDTVNQVHKALSGGEQ